MQPTLFDIRNVNWKEMRRHFVQSEDMEKLGKKRKTFKNKSLASIKAWAERGK